MILVSLMICWGFTDGLLRALDFLQGGIDGLMMRKLAISVGLLRLTQPTILCHTRNDQYTMPGIAF